MRDDQDSVEERDELVVEVEVDDWWWGGVEEDRAECSSVASCKIVGELG